MNPEPTRKPSADWNDEPRRLAENLPENRPENGPPEQEQVVRRNLAVLLGVRPIRMPDDVSERLWARISAELAEPEPRPLWSRPWLRVSGLAAAAAAAAIAVGLGLRWNAIVGTGGPEPAGPGPDPLPPVTAARPEPAGPAASEPPSPTALLAGLRSPAAAYRGTAVIEQFSPDEPTTPTVRRRAVVIRAGADRWRVEGDGMVIVRNGAWKNVRRSGEAAAVALRADDGSGDPLDGFALNAGALAANYRLAVADGGRVADRPTWRLTAEPTRPGRPELRLWVDRATGVRLASEKRDAAGRTVARTGFEDFAVAAAGDGHGDGSGAFEPGTFDLWVAAPSAPPAPADFDPARDAERFGFRPFEPTVLPEGFAVRRSVVLMPAAGSPVLRTVASDGLAVVEILQRWNGDAPAPAARLSGRGIEISEVRDGVLLKVAGEDVDAPALKAVLAGLRRP
jgi:hypothetical protein